ncbi:MULTISPECIES: adenylyl-sulfate kinase [Pseudomonas]|uniref:adenylyl-sulfate kinase n=1 Tax=Pseudomonas TaxID=286 RepID=UPI002E263CFA|nr:adenylyl-sulfate kinase [Pseudomonas sp. JH-2]
MVSFSKANIVWQQGIISPQRRQHLLGQRPCTLWLTGLSGAGKSTLAFALEHALIEQGRLCYVLDGDNVRHGLNRNLGFTPADRAENIRRIAEVARLMNDAGLIVITAFISPYREDRAMAQQIIGEHSFQEVHVSTPLAVCESRDPKGLYLKARNGDIQEFTGISSPYEPPEAPELVLNTHELPVEESLSRLLELALASSRLPLSP